MFRSIKVISLVAGLSVAGVAMAQTPAAAPAGSTGMCRDGSYMSEADALAKGNHADHGKACK